MTDYGSNRRSRIRSAILLRSCSLLFLLALRQESARAIEWLYISASDSTILRYDVSLGSSALVSASRQVYAAAGTSPTNLTAPEGLVFDGQGNLYVANREFANGNTIIKITPSGVRSVYATGLNKPLGLAIDPVGNLYAVNENSSSISKISSDGTVSNFASGLSGPYGLTSDSSRNIFAGNRGNNTVTRYASDGSPILPAPFANTNLNNPRGMKFSSSGDLYVANFGDNTIAKISSNGTATTYLTLAGTGPNDVAFDSVGNLYVANNGNRTIDKYNSVGEFQFSWGLGGPRPQSMAFVPEPSTWILSVAGISVMTIMLRRKIPTPNGFRRA